MPKAPVRRRRGARLGSGQDGWISVAYRVIIMEDLEVEYSGI